MQDRYFISLYLDTRYKKGVDAIHPVKLRVFMPDPRRQKLYPTKFSYKKAEFDKLIKDKRLEPEQTEALNRLQLYLGKARKVAEKLERFTFNEFESRFIKLKGKTSSLQAFYETEIADCKKDGRIGTASNYQCSYNSLVKFNKKTPPKFDDIDSRWLKKYEKFMIEDDRSLTTVGIYLRPLRHIFNLAIERNVVGESRYPFGKDKNKYSIPKPRATKKSLTHDELSKLFHAKPISKEQAKAKAFWFFSYSCNGMNIKDIANMRLKDIDDGIFKFRRKKTEDTSSSDNDITVYLTDYSLNVIKKYGTNDTVENDYIFDIIKKSDDAETKHTNVQKFVRFINQHIKLLAVSVGLTDQISTYWARYAFSTNAVNNGASMEFVQEALGHSNIRTTQAYFKGFRDETKKQITDKLMDF